MNDIRISIPDGCIVENVEVCDGVAVVTIDGRLNGDGAELGPWTEIKGTTLATWGTVAAEKLLNIAAEEMKREQQGGRQDDALRMSEQNIKMYLEAFLELIHLILKKGGGQ